MLKTIIAFVLIVVNILEYQLGEEIKQIIDEGTFEELDEDMQTSDMLNFEGYKDKIKSLQEKT